MIFISNVWSLLTNPNREKKGPVFRSRIRISQAWKNSLTWLRMQTESATSLPLILSVNPSSNMKKKNPLVLIHIWKLTKLISLAIFRIKSQWNDFHRRRASKKKQNFFIFSKTSSFRYQIFQHNEEIPSIELTNINNLETQLSNENLLTKIDDHNGRF